MNRKFKNSFLPYLSTWAVLRILFQLRECSRSDCLFHCLLVTKNGNFQTERRKSKSLVKNPLSKSKSTSPVVKTCLLQICRPCRTRPATLETNWSPDWSWIAIFKQTSPFFLLSIFLGCQTWSVACGHKVLELECNFSYSIEVKWSEVKEVGHHNFWSIVLNDLWSKKICRP